MAHTDIKEIIIINILHLYGSFYPKFSKDFSNINGVPPYSLLVKWAHGSVGAQEGNL